MKNLKIEIQEKFIAAMKASNRYKNRPRSAAEIKAEEDCEMAQHDCSELSLMCKEIQNKYQFSEDFSMESKDSELESLKEQLFNAHERHEKAIRHLNKIIRAGI